MDIKEKVLNEEVVRVIEQKGQVRLEIIDLENILVDKKNLLCRIEGALEFSKLLQERNKDAKV